MTNSAAAISLGSRSKARLGRFGRGAAAIAVFVGFLLGFSTWIHLEIPTFESVRREFGRIAPNRDARRQTPDANPDGP